MSKSISETGHAINISNDKLLIDTCTSFGADYNPSNDTLLLSTMTEQWMAAKAANDALLKTEASLKEPINQRQLLFEPLNDTITKVMAALKSTKANDLVKQDAKTIADRIRGMNKTKPKTGDATAPDPELSAVSQSHQSFVQRATDLLSLGNLLSTVKEYSPNEKPLQVVSLLALQQQMQTANDGIGPQLTTVGTQLLARNRLLYKPETGVITVVKKCKNYVKSVFGSTSAEFKKVSIIKFRDISKKERAKL